MRIVNTEMQEIKDPDLGKGKLVPHMLVTKHHDAVEGSPGKFHYETVKEYEHGKEVKKVWDEEPVKAKPAWDETERVQMYVPYTTEELQEIIAAELQPTVEDVSLALNDLIKFVLEGGASN